MSAVFGCSDLFALCVCDLPCICLCTFSCLSAYARVRSYEHIPACVWRPKADVGSLLPLFFLLFMEAGSLWHQAMVDLACLTSQLAPVSTSCLLGSHFM